MRYISLRNINVFYDQKQVLESVNLDINRTDFIGVIGPNGGGKTTLMKTILKQVPFSGEVHYHISNLRIGYMPQLQDVDKSFPISVKDVVVSGLQSEKGVWGRYGKDEYKRAETLLEMAGINNLSNRAIGELSGGEFQRAILCRAVISNPHVLILDEPTNFVDNRFEKELYELLKTLNEQMAIVMVSHDLGTITSYIKTIVCVNRIVHHHHSNKITPMQLDQYDCPIQLIYHGDIPHTVLEHH
ncbi:MAG: metal ABC transporter ATP-binding protein [Rikenellaceae bacterium]|nr:metal ABC transporter ATP-binding protein [Rikenellaceae bacterium]